MTRHKLSEHHYGGWSPSRPDHRDLIQHEDASAILPEVDPRGEHIMPWIYDQGQLGSCTANAVAAALQYNHGVVYGPKARRPSRLDIYYGERSLEGQLGLGDTGANGRDGFKFAQQTGYLLEKPAWPYDISTFEDPPPPGIRHKLLQPYAAVPQTQLAIQTALSNKQTVAFGFTVYDSFESQAVADTGVVPLPASSEGVLGGHEMLAIGYLASDPSHVLCRNSWGEGWGLAGYCLMPWKYLCSPSLASDLRTIVRPV